MYSKIVYEMTELLTLLTEPYRGEGQGGLRKFQRSTK